MTRIDRSKSPPPHPSPHQPPPFSAIVRCHLFSSSQFTYDIRPSRPNGDSESKSRRKWRLRWIRRASFWDAQGKSEGAAMDENLPLQNATSPATRPTSPNATKLSSLPSHTIRFAATSSQISLSFSHTTVHLCLASVSNTPERCRSNVGGSVGGQLSTHREVGSHWHRWKCSRHHFPCAIPSPSTISPRSSLTGYCEPSSRPSRLHRWL